VIVVRLGGNRRPFIREDPMSTTHVTETARLELSPQRLATRHLVLTLKQLVKSDTVIIRSAKAAVRQLQRGGAPEARSAQAGLSALRREARAHLLVYGLVRGRAWAAMEPQRPAGDLLLAPLLLRNWRDAEAAAARVTGALPPLPEALRTHLPRGAAQAQGAN
jgi:hypothetical protein